ncbi:ABC transporter ATP-binding protein [Salinimicrobium gaetbulicola]|uniref:ABC transporter ATP-binding protein n=1 Tax=Salinimicrobium gaetbulicola TaxID=999702 RepID=A0ABW3IJG4_9FLAO
MSTILKAENISKQYRLGTVGTGTLGDDLKRWWYGMRGKEDPFLKVGAVNERNSAANEDYVWALRDINFEVKQGEVLGIIGKNGAGKSTLLKLLSRVTAPTTGTIKTRGRIASLLEVGTGFHGELTGRENIFMNGAVLGMTKPEIKRKLDEIIAFSGCERYIDTPVKRYSSGMTVRLGFAVAAHLEPEILVVDEVLAVGDAEFQKKAIGKMQDLSTGEGRTVLFVSHNMASINMLCNRTLLLEDGGIRFDGITAEAISSYLNYYSGEEIKDLEDRIDRLGDNKKFKFNSVELHDSEGVVSDVFTSGDYTRLRIGFKYGGIDINKLIITVGIKQNDELICFWAFDELGFRLEKNSSELNLEIPNLNLRGGKYHFWLFSSYGNTREENYCDVIDKVLPFEVIPGDFWGSGKINRNTSKMLLDGNFQ